MIIILDTTTLTALITRATDSEEARKCQDWFYSLIPRGAMFMIPEICDYEVRRGFILLEKKTGRNQDARKENLDKIRTYSDGLSFTLEVSLVAAELWAESTNIGKTQPKGISADIVVMAHTKILQDHFPGRKVIIATRNTNDFIIFDKNYSDFDVSEWNEINF